MWSKGAQKDYLDTYSDYEEEEYYEEEEEVKVEEEKPVVEIKVESKPIQEEIKIVEKKMESETDEEYYDEYEVINSKLQSEHKFNFDEYYFNDELIFDNYYNFTVNNDLEPYKKYQQINSPVGIIKRFGFKKLKSNDKNVYYLDNTLYFIWKYIKNIKTGEEMLVRPDEDVYKNLKALNMNYTIYDKYLSQPLICY
jgi:hypothetical protein